MLCISDTNPLATSQKHLHRRVLADKHYRKNAERMKERYKKIKKIQTFNVGDAVSIRILLLIFIGFQVLWLNAVERSTSCIDCSASLACWKVAILRVNLKLMALHYS